MIHKETTKKTKDRATSTPLKTEVNSRAPERPTVHASLLHLVHLYQFPLDLAIVCIKLK
jgi:hypothetical protein